MVREIVAPVVPGAWGGDPFDDPRLPIVVTSAVPDGSWVDLRTTRNARQVAPGIVQYMPNWWQPPPPPPTPVAPVQAGRTFRFTYDLTQGFMRQRERTETRTFPVYTEEDYAYLHRRRESDFRRMPNYELIGYCLQWQPSYYRRYARVRDYLLAALRAKNIYIYDLPMAQRH